MKKVIALLLAVLMLASLAACSSTPANADAATPAETGTTPSADTTDTADTPETKDETPAAAGDVTIRMWTFLDPTNTSNGRSIALQKMIDRFEEENPGVKVVVEPQQWDTMTGKFMAAATTGRSARHHVVRPRRAVRRSERRPAGAAGEPLHGRLDAGADRRR